MEAASAFCAHWWVLTHCIPILLCACEYCVIMDEVVKAFVAEEVLDECTKDQLVKIADYDKADVEDRRVK